MTPNEMNKFRHIAASAYYVNKGYPEFIVLILGYGKEIDDYFNKNGWTDIFYDVKNNKLGREIGKKLRYKSQKEVFDYIFINHIKPYRKK